MRIIQYYSGCAYLLFHTAIQFFFYIYAYSVFFIHVLNKFLKTYQHFQEPTNEKKTDQFRSIAINHTFWGQIKKYKMKLNEYKIEMAKPKRWLQTNEKSMCSEMWVT